MKYFPESYHKSVDVHGVQVPVRRGIRFVTININNTVQGWACRPELSSVDEGVRSQPSRPLNRIKYVFST